MTYCRLHRGGAYHGDLRNLGLWNDGLYLLQAKKKGVSPRGEASAWRRVGAERTAGSYPFPYSASPRAPPVLCLPKTLLLLILRGSDHSVRILVEVVVMWTL